MPGRYGQWSFRAINRTHKMHREPNWGLNVERGRDSWKGDQGEATAQAPAKRCLQPFTVTPPQGALRCLPVAGSLAARLLPSGPAPLFQVAHCSASGTEVKLLSKEMTYPGRCHYSYSGINREISLIGQVLYGAFLVPCRL